MKKLYLIFLLCLFSCATAPKANLDKENRHSLSTDTIEEVAERVRKVVEVQIIEGKNAGAVVGIYLQGKSKFLFFGETKKGNKTPPNENTIFEIGSLTKTFTGLLLAQEIESKRIKETDTMASIQKKLATQKASNITLLELVTHRSGLPPLPCNMDTRSIEQPYALYSEENLIDLFKDKNLKEHPECVFGEHPSKKINYSNLGFGVLGYLLGVKEKTSYLYLLKKKILSPLNMEDTTYDLNSDQLSRAAQGYDEKGNAVPMWERKIMFGNGAIRSTASEMFLYAQAYLHPETTSLAAAIQHATQIQYDDQSQKIGYSWFINPNGSFWHNGMTGGFASYMKIYPKKDFAIFYLTNTAKDLKCVAAAVSDQPCNN